MGLSSSQARLLSLTRRMHDIEYKAQNLEAQKLQMANESKQVYQEYENALNASKIQVKTIGADGTATFIDATYNSMKELGYILKFGDDRPIITQTSKTNYDKAIKGGVAATSKDYFIALETGRIDTEGKNGSNVIEIYTAQQFVDSINQTGSYKLMADIDLTGKTMPRLTFKGTLDGNGYKITGLGNNSLFNSLDGATVQNLAIQSSINNSVTGDTTIGLLAKTSKGTTNINNVSVSGQIVIEDKNKVANVGGLIGEIESGNTTITNVTSAVNIGYKGDETASIGGIVGDASQAQITISYSNYTGTLTNIKSTSASVGGILGHTQMNSASNKMNISYCTTTGTINSKNTNTYGAGGIVGTVWAADAAIANSAISCSSSDMNIRSNGDAGGIVGYMTGSITGCYSSGTIYGSQNSDKFTGGIAGETHNSTIIYVYSDANVTGKTYTGSVIGGAYDGTQITNASSSKTEINEVGLLHEGQGSTNSGDTSKGTVEAFTAGAGTGATLTTNSTLDTTSTKAQEASELFDLIQSGEYIVQNSDEDLLKDNHDSTTWFSNMINLGLLFLFKKDNQGNEYQVNVATDTNLQEVTNDVDLKKAEAKYEADMRKINQKDKKFDTDLAAMDNERTAIKSEMETLKTVAKDNVDRTFKLFG